MKKIIYPLLLTMLLLLLIVEIIGINYMLDTNSKFRTNFNLMFGYTKWGRDYAEAIIKEEYKGEEITYRYEPAHINSEFDDDVIKPYFVTFYLFTEEKSVTYLAWTDGDTYTIDWEVIK